MQLLKRAAFPGAVNVIGNRRTTMLDSRTEDLNNLAIQFACPPFRDTIGRSARVNASRKENFIGINVADSTDEYLVQEQRLYRSFAVFEARIELIEIHLEGIGPDTIQRLGHSDKVLYAPELPYIIVEKRAIVKPKHSACILAGQSIPEQFPRHPKVYVKHATIEIEEDLLAPPANVLYHRSTKGRGSSPQTAPSDALRQQFSVLDRLTDDVRCDGSNNRLNFRKFRHGMRYGKSTNMSAS
jgi:hypothetical protein